MTFNFQDNKSNGSLLNLFDEAEDFPPIPSPFEFGPLPPCPASTPSPKMERIAEVTETMSSSSETGSVPQTEVEVLEFKEVVMSPKQDNEDVWKAQPEQNTKEEDMKTVDNYEYTGKDLESMHNTMTIKRRKKERKETGQKTSLT